MLILLCVCERVDPAHLSGDHRRRGRTRWGGRCAAELCSGGGTVAGAAEGAERHGGRRCEHHAGPGDPVSVPLPLVHG